ncbi:MAG: hypothetical protein KZQ75_10690 [Candidatus Thiodiazotropha sp. (ex Myrtea spinifera)]|nr:hypothetical protein [Candidatus Thiodiazotropha sp. (ex Myrtea spinifera)]MCU7828441.1 hypothetical protein [Candidatus Thiodiazotropha sp. (ex Myrtea sp. 'scaly one' KF741663)]
MNFGGLVGKAALLKEQMKKKPCKRCGLMYDPVKKEKCPHCGDLDERGLEALLQKKKNEIQGIRQLGNWFLLAAVGLFFLLLLIGLI